MSRVLKYSVTLLFFIFSHFQSSSLKLVAWMIWIILPGINLRSQQVLTAFLFSEFSLFSIFSTFKMALFIASTKKYLQSDWLRGVQYWPYLYFVFNIFPLLLNIDNNKKKKSTFDFCSEKLEKYSLKTD